MREGKALPYNKNAEGPSEIIGTPVFWERKVYVTVGQDTRHGPGKGALTCIDATGSGDISATGKVWTYTGINRSFSTPSIQGGLLFVADFPGDVHCLDAKTGKLHWVHRTEGSMMGSTFVVDGKVFTGNESGQLTILEAGKDLKVLGSISLDSAIDCAPVVANGVLYITTQRRLHAVRSR